jgi:hypothetical protein
MGIDRDHIKNLSELSNEVLTDLTLSPTARLLIQNLLMTTQLLFAELQKANDQMALLKERVLELEIAAKKVTKAPPC